MAPLRARSNRIEKPPATAAAQMSIARRVPIRQNRSRRETRPIRARTADREARGRRGTDSFVEPAPPASAPAPASRTGRSGDHERPLRGVPGLEVPEEERRGDETALDSDVVEVPAVGRPAEAAIGRRAEAKVHGLPRPGARSTTERIQSCGSPHQAESPAAGLPLPSGPSYGSVRSPAVIGV